MHVDTTLVSSFKSSTHITPSWDRGKEIFSHIIDIINENYRELVQEYNNQDISFVENTDFPLDFLIIALSVLKQLF